MVGTEASQLVDKGIYQMQWTCHGLSSTVVTTALLCLGLAVTPSNAQDIMPELVAPAPISPSNPTRPLVTGIRLQGNNQTEETRIRSMVKTRVGREFDPEQIQSDVRRLAASGLFRDVQILTDKTAEGIAVTFVLEERPRIAYIKFLGNESVRDKTLLKKSEMKVEGTLNKYVIEEARLKLEDYYHTRGHGKATVEVVEGLEANDKGVVFMIHEGPLARIGSTTFVGNSIASDGRLKTQIKSKPGWFYILQGQLDKSQVEQDVDSLTAYYRSLGFFKANVNRMIKYSDSGQWAYITFVIDEGPRYEVRNISFVGHTRFETEQLFTQINMERGEFFDQKKMNADIRSISDLYGSQGYIHADVKAEPRFLETPGTLDLVYDIREGDQYRVGNINIEISGDMPHTKHAVIMNRMSLQPGDIIDITKIRDDERRIKASQLFVNEPHRGVTPSITVAPPELSEVETQVAERGRQTYRGQSPVAGEPQYRQVQQPSAQPPQYQQAQMQPYGQQQQPVYQQVQYQKPQAYQPQPQYQAQPQPSYYEQQQGYSQPQAAPATTQRTSRYSQPTYREASAAMPQQNPTSVYSSMPNN
ncbi:BamA/OMP85 family outer membrane protein [Bremerella cremea]|uniref:BamA/OMP85 family outer membrane protein n=1 Tax=Bremerella cremea TaxID=1031537 RepID=UPI0031E9D295